MLYMLRPGVAERIEAFVRERRHAGHHLLVGHRRRERPVLPGRIPRPAARGAGHLGRRDRRPADGEVNHVLPAAGNALGLTGEYEARELCDLIHAESAQVLATYESDFYAGRPALTVNHFGRGQAYYVASRNDARFLDDLYGALSAKLDLARALDADLPEGVSAQLRTDGERRYAFVMNFNASPASVDLGDAAYSDLLTGAAVSGVVELEGYAVMVLAL